MIHPEKQNSSLELLTDHVNQNLKYSVVKFCEPGKVCLIVSRMNSITQGLEALSLNAEA